MTHEQAHSTSQFPAPQPNSDTASGRWARTGDGRWFTPGDHFTARAHTDPDGTLTITHDCIAGPVTHQLTVVGSNTGTGHDHADGSAPTGPRLHTNPINPDATYLECSHCGYAQTLHTALAATNDPLNPDIRLDVLRKTADEHTYLPDGLSAVDEDANCTCGNFYTYGTDPSRATAAFVRHVLAETLFESGHPHTIWHRL